MFHNELDKMTVIYILDLKYILLTYEQQKEFIKDYKMSMETEKREMKMIILWWHARKKRRLIFPDMGEVEEGGLRVVIVGGDDDLLSFIPEWFLWIFYLVSKIDVMVIGGMMGAATAYNLKQLGHSKLAR